MKRLLIAFGLILCSSALVAQTIDKTAHSIGYNQDQKTVEIDGKQIVFGTVGGGIAGSTNIVVVPAGAASDGQIVMGGFPQPVSYFPQILSSDFFVSKGYFPDFVQLRWDVIPNINNITQFQIFRKPLGAEGDSLLIATVGSDVFSYQDETAELGTVFEYTVFARGIADGLRIPLINILQEEGFAFPAGSVSGQITFEGGTVVEGATVLASTEGNLKGQGVSLQSETGFLRVLHGNDDDELELRDGFTLQLWAKYDDDDVGTIFSKGDDYKIDYDGSKLSFKVADATLEMDFANPMDTFFHVAAVYDPGIELRLHAFVNDDKQTSKSMAAGNQPAVNSETLFFGSTGEASFFKGNFDEIRLWNRILPQTEIESNYSRFLAGNEDKLAAYWRLDQGVTNTFYDFARQGTTFRENHGDLVNAVFSDVTPFQSQLSFRGITDEFGNFAITGFPYETSGSLYQFTPLLPFHTFEPNQQVRFVGPGVPIHNEVNFVDISSFKVSGTIEYVNSPFPVEGVNLLVDGQPAADADGQFITTDENGEFTIDVPIGEHAITASLNNHTFVDGGRFPVATEEDQFPTFNFQGPLTGLTFEDSTFVKLAGKVVGGPIEAAKPLGFSRSKNNIGNATIKLQAKRGFDLVDADKNIEVKESNAGEEINSNVAFSTRNVTINPDTETGEFIVFLPPEEYTVTSATAGANVFDDSFKVGIDLRNAFAETKEVVEDTVLISTNGQPIPGFTPFEDEDDYEDIVLSTFQDTLYTIAVDTFKFQQRQDFIFRVTPTIAVTNLSGEEIFGDEELRFVDENLGIDETIQAYNEGTSTYAFGHPVFSQRQSYSMVIDLFEEYNNVDTGESDNVPVVDGKIEITNNIAVNDNLQSLPLNEKGRVIYTFLGGLPNIDLDLINPENSFTRTLNITAVSGNNGAIRTPFRPGDPFRGIIFGGLPTGNNFVTTGPNQIDAILRDPPGSASSAFIEEGSTITNSYGVSLENSLGVSRDLSLQLGFTFETAIGLGAEVTTEVKVENTTTQGFSATSTFNNNSEFSSSITTTETISTDGDDFVGSDGDLFIGRATNIVYGLSNFINLVPVDECELCGDTEVNGYKIGKNVGLRLNPEFSTAFVFSQWSIKNQVLPNLKNIRNSFLVFAEDPSSINPLEDPVYVSKVPLDDERFGSRNTDRDIWGDAATLFTASGPSYDVKFPDGFDGTRSDTVSYYNEQIAGWEFWLAENERQKLEAELIENISFSSGSTIERSIETSQTTTITQSFNLNLEASVTNELGFSLNDFGVSETISLNSSIDFGKESSNEVSETKTYGFTLADGDLGDTYTIDLKRPKDGFGTVFTTRGGATSCPYEPEEVTQFYKPGELLHTATAQREKPVITSEQSEISGVPQNRAAAFTLNLQNISDTQEGFQFEVDVLDGSNPNGAILEIDGAPLGNGLIFQVIPGQTLTQTLAIRQGQDDVFDYENIGIMIRSLCQSDPNDNLPEIADTTFVSAFFVPGCSDISLSSPGNNWVVNTNTPQEDTLSVKIDGYDLNVENFKRIQFQYRPAGSSDFITDMTFYNKLQVTQEEFDAASDPKMFVEDPSILYSFDMSSLPDQEYDIRVLALCDQGPGVTFETPSDVLRGTKDTRRPQLFGAPQPADGILSANDNISIRFSETIAAGLLNSSNFSVRGVLNNAPVDNNVSVVLDGVNDYVRIEDGVDLGRSFTLEFKLKRKELGKEMVIFSKGFINSDRLEIGFTEGDKMFIEVSGERKETAVTFTDLVNFNHYGITYDAETGEFFAYENSRFIFERLSFTNSFSGIGPIALGRSSTDEDRHTNANLLDFRVWDRFRSLTDVFAGISTVLTGSEIGLIGYWPFDEGFGPIAADKARFRTASVFSDWEVLPSGFSLSFDGVDDFLSINTTSTVLISEDTDFTIEFWFNAVSNQKDAVMFSSGRGISGTEVENVADNPAKSLSIGFNEEGRLFVASNGQLNIIDIESDEVLDDDWHHFVLSVSRLGNGSIYLDGEQIETLPRDNFGAILRSAMTIGARGYNTGANTVTQDMFFEGIIDEFRIWGSSLNSTQIGLNNDSRLSGDELGLLAYYPFDDFVTTNGIQQLEGDLDDKYNNPFGANGGSPTNNGAIVSTNTPNIKLQRPVQSVPFDFVVNDDEIVINLSESTSSAIEGTILEITVDKVEDLFENRLSSPVTFTAFVDRNQVVWDRNKIEIQQNLGESSRFAVEVVNLGGTEERFEIINMPQWLTAEPSSGSIGPQSRVSVEFTINSGLNNGYYNEDIFLTTDFGFNEELNLDVEVLEPAPDWTVNPASFEFSMSIVASLRVDGILSRDANDLIAAFIGDEPRGVANLQYVPEFDQYMVFMDIYSNDSEDATPIEFRAFDADQGIEFRDLEPISPTFESNTTLGRPSEPQILSTGSLRSERLGFEKGFSWRSFNLNSASLDNSNTLLEGIDAVTNDRVTSATGVDIYTEGLGWLGTISSNGGYNLDTYYLFFLQNGGAVDVVGSKPDPDTEITIRPGFNRIGYIPDFSLSVSEAFGAIQPENGDIVRGQFAFAIFEAGLGWIGSLKIVEPGQGYLYFSNGQNEKTFTYPEDTFLSSEPIQDEDFDQPIIWPYQSNWRVDVRNFPLNMSLIAEVDDFDSERFTVGVFDDLGLVGLANMQEVQGKKLFFLTAYGTDRRKALKFKAFDRSTGEVFDFMNKSNYEQNSLLGSLEEPYKLSFEGEEEDVNELAFPNPFKDFVEVMLTNPSKEVSWQITDIEGKQVFNQLDRSSEVIKSILWRGTDNSNREISSGVYVVKIISGGVTQVTKVIRR